MLGKPISRRKVLGLMGWGAAVTVLAACQPQGTAPQATSVPAATAPPAATAVPKATVAATPPPAKAAETIELRFISWTSKHTEKDVQPYYEKVYGPAHPNVKLKFEVVPGTDYARIVPTNIAAGTLADSIHINANQHMKYYDSGDFLDLTERVNVLGLDLKKDFWLTGAEIWCGKTMSIPSWGDLYLLYYNKTMLQKEWGKDPWKDFDNKFTFTDFADACSACAKDTNGDGRLDQFGAHLGYTSISLNNQFCWTMGTDIVDWAKMQTKCADPKVIEAHKIIDHWVKDLKIAVPPDALTEATQLGLPAIFAGGKVGFWARSITDISTLKEFVKGDNAFEWDICSMPWYDDTHPGIQLVSGHPYCVYSKTKYPDETFEWISTLGTDGMMWMCTDGAKTYPPHWYPAFNEWMKQNPPPDHINWIPDGFKQGYGIHFRMWTKENVDRIYLDAMERVFVEDADMEETLKGLDALINPAVEYGNCNPYEGVTIPMHGLSMQEILEQTKK